MGHSLFSLLPEDSLARRSASYLVTALLLLATLFLGLGLTLPILETTKLILFKTQYSLLTVTWGLLSDGHLFLGLVVLLFSVIFPVLKLGVLHTVFFLITSQERRWRLFGMIDWLGKWSMADVFIAALIVVSLKTSGMASASELPGLYFFGASVVLTIFAGYRVGKMIGMRD